MKSASPLLQTLWILSFCCFFNILFASSALAATYGPVNVQEIQMVENRADRTNHGYVEYRFRVTNQDKKAHMVSLSIPSGNSHRMMPCLTRSSSGIEVPPESSVILRLLQPPLPITGTSEATVVIDGRTQRNGTLFTPAGSHFEGYSHRSNEIAHVFSSQTVPPNLRDLMRQEYKQPASATTSSTPTPPTGAVTPGMGHTAADPELIVWLANTGVEEWSDSWLAYTRFDCIALTVDDWKNLESRRPQVLTAIRQYVEAGGLLCVVGDNWNAPKEWTVDPGNGKRYRGLLGSVYCLEKDLKDKEEQINPFRETVLEQSRLWNRAFGNSGPVYHGGRFSTTSSGILSGNTSLLNSMPVLENYGVSVKLIMVLIVVFAILIGPVNIYVLSLLKRRIWLLWTVPLTSLIASLLVLGASFLQEGFLRQSSSDTYTILDQRREEAVSFGFVGFYSTLTPNGIIFSPDTEATACMTRGYSGENRSLEMSLVSGGNQFFNRGWIHARIPSYFALRKAQSQRKERINFDWSGTAPSATNGLGIDIKHLTVRSPEGDLYQIDELKAGQKETLEKMSAGNKKPSLFDAQDNLNRSGLGFMQSGPTSSSSNTIFNDSDKLPAGSYLAEIEHWNPFIEPGVDRMKPYKNKTTIFGFFE